MARAQAATRLFDVFNVMQVDVFNVMQVDQVVPRELTQIDTREADAAIQSAQLVGFNPEQLNECIGKLAAAKQEQRRRQLLEQQARHFLNRALSETDPLLSACNPIVMQERIDQMRDLGLGNDPIVEQAERKLVEVRMAHAEVAKLQQQLKTMATELSDSKASASAMATEKDDLVSIESYSLSQPACAVAAFAMSES